ncbi:MAG: hypothetical protein GY679_04470 [Mycoplasma sp.]|nr:hypothetical protein [Mycoplasma sp.]
MYKKDELLSISLSPVIKFLASRFNGLHKSYRGKHYLQHSRTPIEQTISFLKLINKHQKDGWLKIPKGDEYHPVKKPKGYKMSDYPEYERLINDCSKLDFTSIPTSQSLKKITFVDMDRMGLLERARVTASGKLKFNTSEKRFSPDKVRISEFSKRIIEEENTLKHPQMIARGFQKAWGSEYDILHKLIFIQELRYISIEEFVFFVSWVNYDNNGFTIVNCVEKIKEYRSLSKNIKESISLFFKNNSKGHLSKKSKEHWDWGNWKNEAMSIFGILKDTGLFLFNKKTQRLSIAQEDKFSFKRQKNITRKYDLINSITEKDKKNSGFEYHHIIPFSWIKTLENHKIIDNKLNLIYISGTKHNQIPKRNNSFVKLSYNSNKLILTSQNKEKIKFKIGKDVFISKENILQLIKYNTEALEAIK